MKTQLIIRPRADFTLEGVIQDDGSLSLDLESVYRIDVQQPGKPAVTPFSHLTMDQMRTVYPDQLEDA